MEKKINLKPNNMKKVETKKETVKEEFKPIVIESSMPFKITITEGEYFVENTPGLGNDLAAILITRKISEQLKQDIDRFKKMKVKQTMADKRHMDMRYAKLSNSIDSLSDMADELLADALRQSQKKTTK